MSGALQAVFQNLRSFAGPPGQQAYTTAGTYSWVAPTGVTKVSVVAVAGGYCGTSGQFTGCGIPRGGNGGGGGSLAYTNNFTVIPGNSYSVVVGCVGGCSSFNNTTAKAGGNIGQCGGVFISGTGGANGGQGGSRTCYSSGGGGGGAAGYSGNGGQGGGTGGAATAGSGGGGGGGGRSAGGSTFSGAGGGGVGILGQGSNGAGGCNTSITGGCGGSCGANGSIGAYGANGGAGGLYGGGGGGGAYAGSGYSGGAGKNGAVRIIWPGNTRSFPSTNTGDL